jgi:hypothetical protein
MDLKPLNWPKPVDSKVAEAICLTIVFCSLTLTLALIVAYMPW